MPRRPKQLNPAQEALFEKLARQGRSAQEISDALGGAISRAVAGRRAAALLGSRRLGKHGATPATASSGVASDVEPPEPSIGDDTADLDTIIETLSKPEGVMPTAAAAVRLRLQAIALRAKLRPPPARD